MEKFLKIIALLSIGFFVFSCSPSTQQIKTTNKISKTVESSVNPNKPNSNTKIKNRNKNTQKTKTSEKELVYVPTIYSKRTAALSHNPTLNVKNRKALESGIKISVENMPLNKFINLIFNKILNVNYYIGKRVQRRKDPITLKMQQPLSLDQFMSVIKFILQKYAVSIQKRNGIYYIVSGRLPEKKILPPIFIGRKVPTEISGLENIGVIVPFHYVNPAKYTSLIRQIVLSRNSYINLIDQNKLIIIDGATRVKQALKLINILDRPFFEQKTAILIRLDYLSPTEFIDKLKKLLPLEGIPVALSPKQPGIVLVPIDELNSLLVITPKNSWLHFVLFWKKRLDIISALGDQPRLFVYYPKNRRAEDLAKIIEKFGKAIVSTKKPKKGKTKSNPAFRTSGNIEVSVDEGRNCIVILATPSQYEQIKQVLEKLDTLPKQVLVQVTIAEVTLTNNLQYGIEWYLKHTGKYSGTLTTVGTLGLGSSGINYSIISDTKKFEGLINAFAKKNLINILSSPRLVVLDNQEASITVGTQVPTLLSTTTNATVSQNGTSALVNTIQYRKTGVILHIKPTINSNGILTMTISQEVSSPQTNNVSNIDSPIILDRNITTSVVLKSGSTLLLGGLIKSQKSKTVNKVPILGDIPLLGYLFKTTSKSTIKTELIIEITPYILSNTAESVQATQRFESLLKWFHQEE